MGTVLVGEGAREEAREEATIALARESTLMWLDNWRGVSLLRFRGIGFGWVVLSKLFVACSDGMAW